MARILLVEDDLDNISLLTRLLTHHGHEIKVADNAESAFTEAKAFAPQMILMDLELPPTGDSPPNPNAGLDATRRLKSDPETASIPVVALTAHTMAQHQEKIAAAGCDDFQEKPITPFNSLLEKIAKHTG
ncbi:MAG: response regulator [Verrucomicrobiales bacterium]|nr:response regulator [Verrucomicrobiales bacterium]